MTSASIKSMTNLFCCSSIFGSLLNMNLSIKNMVRNSSAKEKIQKYVTKYTVSRPNAVEMMIFSPDEKGVMMLPILMHIVIPSKYVPDLIFKK